MKNSNLTYFFITLILLGFLPNLMGQDLEIKDDNLQELTYKEVSNSVTMLHNQKPYGSNITCIALDAGLVFIDCGLFTGRAKKFRTDMEEKYGKKTLALVLSHSHTDHFFGMGAFDDVPILAPYAGKTNFKQQLSIDYAKYVEGYKRIFPKFDEALKEAKLQMPTFWYNKELELGFGDSKLIVRNTGGHSICMSYVYFEKEGVIVAGDNVQAEYHPYFGDPTGNMETWIKTLKEWETLNLISVCPGHGPVIDTTYLKSTRVFFEDLYATLVKLKKENTPIEEVVKYNGFPEGYWPSDLEKPVWYDPSVAFIYNNIQLGNSLKK